MVMSFVKIFCENNNNVGSRWKEELENQLFYLICLYFLSYLLSNIFSTYSNLSSTKKTLPYIHIFDIIHY